MTNLKIHLGPSFHWSHISYIAELKVPQRTFPGKAEGGSVLFGHRRKSGNLWAGTRGSVRQVEVADFPFFSRSLADSTPTAKPGVG